jgi:hypothetical protein
MEKKKGQPITVLSEAVVVPSGVVRLMELQEKGWSCVRPKQTYLRYPNEILFAVGGPFTCQSNFLPDAIQSGELERRFLTKVLPIEHADFQPCIFR